MEVECEREGCERAALYQLADGDLCGPHAVEADIATVQFLADSLGRIPEPVDDSSRERHEHECNTCGTELVRERQSELVAALLDHFYEEHTGHE